MARKALYKHATQVDASSYPDDGTSPVGTTEWNADPDPQGMLGVTPATSTITIASGVATITDSVTVVAAESSTSDTLDKVATTNTNEYDLLWLFADTGDTITLTHTASPSAAGHIFTVSGANETLSTTKPTILIRKGSYWYGYGGGTVSDGSITTAKLAADAVTAAKIADDIVDSEHLVAGGIDTEHIGALQVTTAKIAADAIDGTKIADDAIDSEHYTDGSIDNAHIADDQIDSEHYADGSIDLAHMSSESVDEDNLHISNAGSNGEFLSKQSGNSGGLTWASAGGGATAVHAFTNTTTTGYLGTASSFGSVGAGDRDIYIKKIDSNNEGVFTKIWKNGAAVEVQLA